MTAENIDSLPFSGVVSTYISCNIARLFKVFLGSGYIMSVRATYNIVMVPERQSFLILNINLNVE